MIGRLAHLSLVGGPAVAVVSASIAIALGLVLRRSRHPAPKLLGVVVAVAVAGALGVNQYFDYLPDVGALLGARARDQISARGAALRLHRASYVTDATAGLRGVVEEVHIPALRSHFVTRAAQVYLPPAWFASPRPALPVIELLHGTPGSPLDWTRAGRIDVVLDDYAARHDGVAPIVVMPDENGSFLGDTECVDLPRRAAELYLVSDVRAWAVRALGAAPDRSSWLIAGSSEGGYCALALALRHRDEFASFADFGGLDRPTFHGGTRRKFASRQSMLDHVPADYVRHHHDGQPLSGWFEVGSQDGGTTRAVERAARAAAKAGVAIHLRLVPNGHHTWRVWRTAFADAMPWMTGHLATLA